jgi:hypothetical protein
MKFRKLPSWLSLFPQASAYHLRYSQTCYPRIIGVCWSQVRTHCQSFARERNGSLQHLPALVPCTFSPRFQYQFGRVLQTGDGGSGPAAALQSRIAPTRKASLIYKYQYLSSCIVLPHTLFKPGATIMSAVNMGTGTTDALTITVNSITPTPIYQYTHIASICPDEKWPSNNILVVYLSCLGESPRLRRPPDSRLIKGETGGFLILYMGLSLLVFSAHLRRQGKRQVRWTGSACAL